MSSTRCCASTNRSCELTRRCILASLETARSFPRVRIKTKTAQTNTRTMHNRNTHVQHTRVLRKTLCVRGLGFTFALGWDVVERLLSVSLWSTVVRWIGVKLRAFNFEAWNLNHFFESLFAITFVLCGQVTKVISITFLFFAPHTFFDPFLDHVFGSRFWKHFFESLFFDHFFRSLFPSFFQSPTNHIRTAQHIWNLETSATPPPSSPVPMKVET